MSKYFIELVYLYLLTFKVTNLVIKRKGLLLIHSVY